MGRPPKPAEAKRTERMSLYLTPEEADRVKQQAAGTGLSLNQILALAVAAGLATLGALAISDLIKQSRDGGGTGTGQTK